MPDWLPHLRSSLESARNWVTVSDLQRSCQEKFREQWATHNPGRTRPNFPKPSAPTLQGILRSLLRSRDVVAKLGSYGAAYFALLSRASGSSRQISSNPRTPYRNFALRRRCVNFNDRVENAIRNGGPLPDPWVTVDGSGNPIPDAPRQATARAPLTPFPEGPIREEPLNIIPRLFQERDWSNWDEEALRFIQRLPHDDQVTFDRTLREVRGFVSALDIVEALRAALPALLEKARAKAQERPKNLETEYFDRLRAKGERLD